jgi:hypothetical protein
MVVELEVDVLVLVELLLVSVELDVELVDVVSAVDVVELLVVDSAVEDVDDEVELVDDGADDEVVELLVVTVDDVVVGTVLVVVAPLQSQHDGVPRTVPPALAHDAASRFTLHCAGSGQSTKLPHADPVSLHVPVFLSHRPNSGTSQVTESGRPHVEWARQLTTAPRHCFGMPSVCTAFLTHFTYWP